MFRSFIRDSFLYGLSNVVARASSVLLVPVYTRALSPADFGVIDLMLVLISVVNVTIALEISQGVARYFMEARTDDERSRYASSSLWFTVATYTAFAVVMWLLAGDVSEVLLHDRNRVDIIRVAAASAWSNGLFYLGLNQLRYQLRPMSYAAVSVAATVVTIITTVLLVVVFRMGAIGVLIAQLVGYTVGLTLVMLRAQPVYRFLFDASKCAEMLRFSIPLVPSSIGVFVTLYVDRIAISRLMSLEDLGQFGIGYRVASVVTLVMIGFQGALSPLIYAHHNEEGTPRELARIFRVFVSLALIGWLALSLFAREIVMVFTTPAFHRGSDVVPLLALAIILSGMYVFAPGLWVAKRTGVIAVINITGAVLNTVLNLVLIPMFGITGAALATMLAAACVFGSYMIASQRLYFVPHSWRLLGAGCAVAAAGFALGQATRLPDPWIELVKLLLTLMVTGAFIAIGLIGREEIRGILHLVTLRRRSA